MGGIEEENSSKFATTETTQSSFNLFLNACLQRFPFSM